MRIHSLRSLLSIVGVLTLSAIQAEAVTLGSERLTETQYASLLVGKKVGVLAHHASRDHQGVHLVDRLAALNGIQLKMIFAPEHGYRSIDDDLMPDSTDPQTGLPVYSLYGPRKAPTPEMFSKIDVMVIDLQDVGLRYYTYPATVVYALQAAQKAGVKVVLLDRPSPIGSDAVEGAVLEKSLVTGGLTNLAAIPTRHGMTLGELAIYFNRTMKIGADLTVVPLADYQRSMLWKDTGLPWTPASPALVDWEQSVYYAVFGSLEAVSLAVGRGQTNELAFKVFGAPWITEVDQKMLVAKLNLIQGLKATAYTWTPSRATYEGKLSRGVKLELTSSVNSFATLVDTLKAMKRIFGTRLDLNRMATMIGGKWVLQAIEKNEATSTIVNRAQSEYSGFLADRNLALLYH